MSKCCKCAKWWPHNWICLKGLHIFFTVMFYVAVVYAIVQAIAVFRHPLLTGSEMWAAAAFYVISDLGAAIVFLTISKILGALRKIKKAVSPCCCGRDEHEENHIETVVEEESK